jgi:lysophospholipase L1-like esterase
MHQQIHRLSRALTALTLAATALARGQAPAPVLQPGDKVAICGDSITEQKKYSVYIEDYLLMCQPVRPVQAVQFGWSGETASGFAKRMANDVLRFKPSVATTCYGMNDGRYRSLTPETEKTYRDKLTAIVRAFKDGGVRQIIIGSPGAVDTRTYQQQRGASFAREYNQTLAALGGIAEEIARREHVIFANVHDPMMEAMAKAKAKYGDSYHVAGPDGVHPSPNGHIIMAYAFLKAMGFNGDIGTITLDASSGSAQATEGHKVLSATQSSVEIESTRYPFCFYGDPSSPGATAGIIEFFPFNEELNRLTLVVKGLSTPRAQVTWGNTSRKFSASDLARGVNLAAEFIENPFCAPFRAVEAHIDKQQAFETPYIKSFVTIYPSYTRKFPDAKDEFDTFLANLGKEHEVLTAASAAAVAPVRHTIHIKPVAQ